MHNLSLSSLAVVSLLLMLWSEGIVAPDSDDHPLIKALKSTPLSSHEERIERLAKVGQNRAVLHSFMPHQVKARELAHMRQHLGDAYKNKSSTEVRAAYTPKVHQAAIDAYQVKKAAKKEQNKADASEMAAPLETATGHIKALLQLPEEESMTEGEVAAEVVRLFNYVLEEHPDQSILAKDKIGVHTLPHTPHLTLFNALNDMFESGAAGLSDTIKSHMTDESQKAHWILSITTPHTHGELQNPDVFNQALHNFLAEHKEEDHAAVSIPIEKLVPLAPDLAELSIPKLRRLSLAKQHILHLNAEDGGIQTAEGLASLHDKLKKQDKLNTKNGIINSAKMDLKADLGSIAVKEMSDDQVLERFLNHDPIAKHAAAGKLKVYAIKAGLREKATTGA